MKKNLYTVEISIEGYVRLSNENCGEIICFEKFEVEDFTFKGAIEQAESLTTGINPETFVSANFDVNLNDDEIIRNDTETKFKAYLTKTSDEYSYFLIESIINENSPYVLIDLKGFFKYLGKNKTIIEYLNQDFNEKPVFFNHIKQEYHNFLEDNYFYVHKIRLDVPFYNFNGVKPETLINKMNTDNYHYTEATFYNNDFESMVDLMSFLNQFLINASKDNDLNLVDRKIVKPKKSNNQIKKEKKSEKKKEKQKIKEILKEKKKKFLKEIELEMKNNGINFDRNDFQLNIKIND